MRLELVKMFRKRNTRWGTYMGNLVSTTKDDVREFDSSKYAWSFESNNCLKMYKKYDHSYGMVNTTGCKQELLWHLS